MRIILTVTREGTVGMTSQNITDVIYEWFLSQPACRCRPLDRKIDVNERERQVKRSQRCELRE